MSPWPCAAAGWPACLLEAAAADLTPATQAVTLLAARCHAWRSEAARR